ncbi:hypothetical protein [Actinoallomurus sp. CA-142502]|uniref:hypothetical protein n=1 Tax=Actinoallomurus sp. CA-142502 TaxID=3239885 RepID=UPI003D939B5D
MAHDRRRQPSPGAPLARAAILIVLIDVGVCIAAPWLIHPAAKAFETALIVVGFSAVVLLALAVAWRRVRPPRGH